MSIKEKSLKQNKSVVSSKTNNNETDRIAKIRQIQKDAFKKETPVKVESKKNEILIKVRLNNHHNLNFNVRFAYFG